MKHTNELEEDKEYIKIKCPLCNSTDVGWFHSGTRETPDRDMYRCYSCDVGFLSDFDHIEDTFYQNNGILTPNKGGSPADRIKHFALENERRYERFKNLLPNKKVLDFGCGSGGFLRHCQPVVSKCNGVEPSYDCRDFLREGGIICSPNLLPLIEAGTRYDLIFAFHVFEHLKDPVKSLIQLRGMLNNGGRIYIEVPNLDDVFFSTYQNEAYKNFNVNDPHLFYFNKRSLTYLAAQASMDIDFVEYVQRYSLANHLHWLAKDEPGGDKAWFYLDNPELDTAYKNHLKSLGQTDAIMIALS